MSIQLDSSAMPIELTVDTYIEPEFVCACEEWRRTACVGEGFFGEHEGQRYCVLHYPGKAKVSAFSAALQKKLKAQDFDFRGVWFPGPAEFRDFEFSAVAHFEDATFNENANFVGAKFSNLAHFEGTKFNARAFFNGAKFKLAIFTAVVFCDGAHFTGASFSGNALFGSATFSKNAHFENVTFLGQANFGLATFNANAEFGKATWVGGALFLFATFASYARFAGDKHHQVFGDRSYLNLQHVRFEKPERASFHALRLRPHWFVNVDARKFEFVNVEWPQPTVLTPEIESLHSRQVSSPHRVLSIAYRQLAVNAEESHRYNEASDFRYNSMDVRRLEWMRGRKVWTRQWSTLRKTARRLQHAFRHDWGIQGRTWRRSWRFLKAYRRSLQVLHWLYWAASGYGERITRAVVVLFALWLLFASAYCVTGFERKPAPSATTTTVMSDETGRPLSLTKALTYSLGVMSLQKPEPRPVTNIAQTLVMLETIFGPLQAALLALAIRRKFMR